MREQKRILDGLQELQREVREAARQGSYAYRGDDFAEEARTKRRMREELERIAVDLSELGRRLAQSGRDDGDLERQLDRALDDLSDSRVADQLTLAAQYFDVGRPLTMMIHGQERRVHDALARLHGRLENVAERFAGAEPSDPGATVGIADIQALRRQLRELGAGGDPRTLAEIVDTTARLTEDILGGQGSLDLAETRRTYRGLGASEANRERLYRLTLAELDQLEIALGKVHGTPIRAEEPRDEAYDSAAVAEYFRRLSSGP